MIKWNHVTLKYRTSIIFPDVSIDLTDGRSIGIIGHNNTGKTTLAKAIAGEIPVWGGVECGIDKSNVAFVPFHSTLKLLNGRSPYRQQRWNNIETEFVPTVKAYLMGEADNALLEKFGLLQLLDSFLINLSNGEMKKLELVKALSKHPQMVVLDNAFTGLDVAARQLLSEMIDGLVADGVQVVLTGLAREELPISIQHFLFIGPQGLLSQDVPFQHVPNLPFFSDEVSIEWKNGAFDEIINIEGLSLGYGSKTILKNIHWQVMAGQQWALLGHNGSGKTSLLNLIFADNPKAYLSNIRLFGQQKGSGESIWDIKRRIGFISPEMHQYLPPRQIVTDVICSGFYDTEGMYRQPSGYHLRVSRQWLRLVGLEHLSGRAFEELSTSSQRLVLFLRTLVKNPPLLILDEPFQGLDTIHVEFLKKLLNKVAGQSNCAMIFVTHHPSEIPTSFKYILKLKNGEIEKD